MKDVYNLFPSVRKWRKYPDEIKCVTSPEDFSMSKLECKLLSMVSEISHKIAHWKGECFCGRYEK